MKAPSPQLESALAQWVEKELRQAGAQHFDQAKIHAAIREVLAEKELHDDELPFARNEAGEVGSGDVRRAVELRLRRAVVAGLNIAGEHAHAATILLPPRILAADPSAIENGEDLTVVLARETQTLIQERSATLGWNQSKTETESLRVLVVGDPQATETFDAATEGMGAQNEISIEIVTARGLAPLVQAMRELLEHAEPQRSGLAWRNDAKSMIGFLFHDKYRIEACLGEGGFGRVYKATEELVGYPVAIKLLQPQLRKAAKHVNEFMEEARRLFSLEHENIGGWKVFDRTPEGDWYFVMEFLKGEDLETTIEREQRLSPQRTGRILLQTLRALEKAHFLNESEGILHLDLKPKNVFLVAGADGKLGKVKVIDFGVGQLIRRSATRADAANRNSEAGPAASAAQQVTGLTLDYASPEQSAYMVPEAPHVALDGRSDIFSLGVMGFRMLTGKFPLDRQPPPPSAEAGFEKDGRLRKARLRTKLQCPTLASTGVRVPRRLAAFIERCLALDREKRFPDSRVALAELERIVYPPITTKALAITGALVVITAGAAFGITRWLAPPSQVEFALLHDGSEVSEARPLYFGPQRPSLELELDGADGLDPIRELDLVETALGGAVLSGWRVESLVDGRVRISAPAAPTSFSKLVHLEQETIQSKNFRLAYLDPSAWSAGPLAIEGWDKQRSIDPQGVRLLCPISFASSELHECLARAALTWSDAAGEHESMPMSARTELPRGLELDLGGLSATEGDVVLRARIADHAGNEVELGGLNAHFVDGPLELTATLEGPRVGNAIQLFPSRVPKLHLSVNRRARVHWIARDDSGVELGASAKEGLEITAAALREFPQLTQSKGTSYFGRLTVSASERDYVLRKRNEDRSDAQAVVIDFRVDVGEISVRTGLFARAAGTRRPLRIAGEQSFVETPQISWELTRGNSLPITVRYSLWRQTENGLGPVTAPAILDQGRRPLGIIPPIDIDLPEDGAYQLKAEIQLFDPVAGVDLDQPREIQEAWVVLDRIPPRFELEAALADGVVLRSLEALEAAPIAVKGFDVITPGAGAPALQAQWRCSRSHDAREWSGRLEVSGGGATSLTVPPPAGGWEDGKYLLALSGADAAGNLSSEEARLSWELATTGPALQLEWKDRDPDKTPWTRVANGWEISVIAEDPNVVDRVDCRIEAVDDAALRVERALRHNEARRRWVGEFQFPHEWSSKKVRIQLSGADKCGATSLSEVAHRTLEMIAPKVFPGLGVHASAARSSVEVEAMRLVRGNAADRSAYLFRGRPDSVENNEFRRDGVPDAFSTGISRAMSIEYDPREIEDFYLDAHEVGLRQYLAFVSADDGYIAAENWPGGARPDPARRDQLGAMLLKVAAADLPITAVDWREAFAYARWVGKRLPSLVEHEYAVRGGIRYRSWSGANGVLKMKGAVNFGGVGALGKREFGEDRTPEGIWNLSGNVSEWSATPTSFDSENFLEPLQQFKQFRKETLDPRLSPLAQSASQYYASGGSFESLAAHFFKLDELSAEAQLARVGFRCAISRSQAEAQAKDPGPQRFVFELQDH